MCVRPRARHRFRPWMLSVGWLCCAMFGCGGKAPPTQVTAKTATQPVTMPPQQPAPSGVDRAADKPRRADSPRTGRSKTSERFADEDPKNLFEITDTGSEVAVPSVDAEADRFVVGEVSEGADSSHFVVQASNETSENGRQPFGNSRGPARNAEFKLPEKFVEIPSFGYSREGLPWRIRGEKTGGVMALVPGGQARVGSTDGPDATQPEFTPFLETFYMDVTEVTLGEYGQFRDDMKQQKNSRVQPPLNEGQDGRLPALGVPWGIAQGFAHWAGKELPTESEFEKAARGPDGFRTPWGNGRAVWPTLRTPDLITPAAAFPTDQSVYGIYDLAGNAREWCSDWYSDTAHQQASQSPERTLRNWAGPKKASVSGQRVVKGNGPDWSAWHREGRVMNDRATDIGFRCVLRVKVPQTSDAKGG